MPDDPDLMAILSRYPASARPIGGLIALGNAGGFSGARLWRYESGRGPRVVRAWPPPPGGPGRADLERVHGWIGAAGPLGFVPVPIAARDGRTVQEQGGRLWELAPWLPGRPDPARPPGPGRLRAGFAGLAALHRAWAGPRVLGPSPGLARRARELGDLLAGGFDSLDRALRSAPVGPLREPARRWLDAARRLAPAEHDRLRHAAGRSVALQPCLRDARPEHLLFEGDRLVGVVDYGAMGVDAVSADLGRLLVEWVGPDRPARGEALAAYEAVRPLATSEAALIDAFDRSAALLMGGHWARWHFLEGRAFDDPDAVRLGLDRGLRRVARLAAGPGAQDAGAGWPAPPGGAGGRIS